MTIREQAEKVLQALRRNPRIYWEIIGKVRSEKIVGPWREGTLPWREGTLPTWNRWDHGHRNCVAQVVKRGKLWKIEKLDNGKHIPAWSHETAEQAMSVADEELRKRGWLLA